ncbi:EAL domain-containing protein [Colwellia sp. MB02u-6]|uniref:EAL domain-containing protein n=1 Tax=Colwellia sp. MB02u-6 TaxID=2759824 RepID=UPI0015F4F839|nr:EAL domain-containing protein [Colwellia sp. MB02u-6]MBA6328241.1 EAL domain-containing protein [Colwellia sp. MB02u-6]
MMTPSIRFRYLLAVFLLATLVTTSWVWFSKIISQQNQDAQVINLAGQQRMLSQRIALLFNRTDKAGEIDVVNKLLKNAVTTFASNHNRLTNLKNISDEAKSLYLGEIQLDARSKTLINFVNSFIKGLTSRELLVQQIAEIDTDRLLYDLNLVVSVLESDAQNRVSSLYQTKTWIWVLTMTLLILIVLFIFEPMKRLITRKISDLKLVAHYDLLTSLPNQVLLTERLSQAMKHCQRRNQSLAVAFMDLDGFKDVNDLHGHDVGDELLIEVAKRMKEALREGDTLARIGGDEFIAVMVDLENIEDSEPPLKRLLKAAADPVNLGDAAMQVSASIGVSLYPQDHVDVGLLMRHADQAMYIAKQAGKNRYHFFDATQDSAITIQWKNIDDIRSALDRREFLLHYQPKVNMRTSEVIGVEALIRWQHPVRGLVPPLDFLPAIEGHALSLELGEWVIYTALSQINQWRSMGLALPISVNISAYQLQQRNFSTRLAASLSAHPDVNPHYLELEILETGVLSDINQVFDNMSACHDLGVRFALDDFGTGYSSLTHIKRLPAYLIKIDQSFVRDMLEDVDDLAIVESVIGLAKTFKREVIAEGVETIEHGVALLKLDCELAQGYGIARPMPSGNIPEWVSNWKADDSWQAYKG